MVEILRNKWCEDLEDLLQCPICMMCPTNEFIYQCTEGHHVCQGCKHRLGVCPTCGKNWTLYRNRLAENMCSKFDDIKLSLIDPEAEINKLLIMDKFCAATQTDDVDGATIVTTVVVPPATAKQASDGHSGPYPCCIGTCDVKMCYEALIEHIKTEHSLHYCELPLGNVDLLFEHSWYFDYAEESTLDCAFRIRDVGTFVVKLATDKCGDFTGYIVMIHCGFVSKQFSYQLKITSGGDHGLPSFVGNVNSCRSPATTLGQYCLRVKGEVIRKIHDCEKPLKCTLLLSRKLQMDEGLLPKSNGQNKKRGKNRNRNVKANIQSAAML